MTATVVQAAIEPALERGECEHTAILLQSVYELPSVLASFYRLGEARNGWLVHGSLPGQGATDRQSITNAGIDVAGWEAAGRMAIIELDLSLLPDEWVKPWSELLQDKLSAGFDAMWFARFPIGPTPTDLAGVLPFEAAWMKCFRGRRVVTLCPYIVGDIDDSFRSHHRGAVARVHQQVVQAG